MPTFTFSEVLCKYSVLDMFSIVVAEKNKLCQETWRRNEEKVKMLAKYVIWTCHRSWLQMCSGIFIYPHRICFLECLFCTKEDFNMSSTCLLSLAAIMLEKLDTVCIF